jgi:hypothetical protein
MSAGVCIGCGVTLFPDRVAVEGLDLCRACLAPRAAPRRLGEYYPPLWWGAAEGGALLGAILLGGALGRGVEAGLQALGLGLLGNGAALGAGFGVALFAWRLRTVIELLDRRWKRKTAERLGLAHLPLERFAFAAFLLTRDCPGPEDVGLLAETEDALVFLGRRSGMTVVPLSSVRADIIPDGFCGVRWACLGMGDGSCRWILIMEGGETAWGRDAATAAFAERLYTKLVHPRLGIPRWEEAVGGKAEALAGLRAATVPERVNELWKLAKGIPLPPDVNPTRDELDEAARRLVAMALSLLLVDRGWAFASDRGTYLLTRDGIDLDPYCLLQKLANKELSAEEWRKTWTQAGVAEVDLGEFAALKRKARRKPEDRSGANA